MNDWPELPEWVRQELHKSDCAARQDINGEWIITDLPAGKRLAEYPFVGEPVWVDR